MGSTVSLQHEPRPRDFSARIKRSRQHSLADRWRRRTRGRGALVLLGAFTLPAFAQPQDWDRFTIGNADHAEASVAPMPFETAGASFPGSAFYYLDLDAEPQGLGEGIHSDADVPQQQADGTIGPVARAMRVDNSGVDRGRAEQCLAAAIYYEAASESDSGQRAVAQVVLNRVAHPAYPNTVCGVVYQGSERRTGCQFSFTCDGSLARKPSRLFWMRAESAARMALAGYVHTPVGLATHYHTVQVHPYWAPKLHYLTTIGAHRFYNFRGVAGRAGTFRFAYGGGEPLPAPHRREAAGQALAAATTQDPVAVQEAFDARLAQTTRSDHVAETPAVASSAGQAPIYTRELAERGGDALYRGNDLPDGAGIKPEYRNSGRWIARPAS